jgi:hypothetical protein
MTNLNASTAYATTDENAARDTIAFMLNDENLYVTAEGTPLVVLVEIEGNTGTGFVVVALDSDGSEIEDMDIASGNALAAWKNTLPAATAVVDIECFTVTTPGTQKAVPQRTPSRLLCGVAYQLR